MGEERTYDNTAIGNAMRQIPHSKRQRGRGNGGGGGGGGGGRKPHASLRSQTFDSNGPNVRIRGSAYQVLEKYLGLARDSASAGDRVAAENYYQHAEHYLRLINASGGQNENGSGQSIRSLVQADQVEDDEAEAEEAAASGLVHHSGHHSGHHSRAPVNGTATAPVNGAAAPGQGSGSQGSSIQGSGSQGAQAPGQGPSQGGANPRPHGGGRSGGGRPPREAREPRPPQIGRAHV